MKILQYIYYKIFQVHSRGEDNFVAAFMSVMTISVAFFLNFMIIEGFLIRINIISKFIIQTKFESILFGVIIILINYFIFMRNKKYIKIIKMFENEGKKNKLIGNIIVLLYFVSTVLLSLLIPLTLPL